MKKSLLTSLFLFAVTASLTLAATTGKIAGKVRATDGSALPSANVFVVGTSMGAATDSDGNYYILNVPPGTYRVRVDYIGYKSVVVSNVVVSIGLTSEHNFSLVEAAVTGETVEIVAQKPLVEKSATNAVRRMGSEQIENFATRNVGDMFSIQPGVVSLNGLLHIRGSRPDEVGYEIEGATTKAVSVAGASQSGQQAPSLDLGGGGGYNLVTAIPEALEEVSLQSGGYSADLGGSNAGIIQQTIRTGGEKLSGSFLYETDALAPSLGGDDTYSYGFNDMTFSLGGPLLSPRIRFFGAVQKLGVDDYNPQVWDGGVIKGGEKLPDLISGLTPSGDSASVAWDGGKVSGRRSDRTNFNGTVLADLSPLVLRFGLTASQSETRLNSLPIYAMFNEERLPQRDQSDYLLSASATFFLSPKTFVNLKVNTLKNSVETYDPNFNHETTSDLLTWGDSLDVSGVDTAWAANFKSRYTPPDPYNLITFPFAKPGDLMTGYSKGEQSYVGASGGLVSQRGAHELKAGFDYRSWTVRRYSFDRSGIVTINQSIDAGVLTEADITDETDLGARVLRQSRVFNVGYDEFGNELDDNSIDRPRHPTSLAFYLNDKVEMRDVIVNAGLRVDQFDLDDFKLDDPTNPPYDQTGFSADEDGLKESATRTEIQPRLGLAFPLSDRSVFHLQYGKFAQMPDLAQPYKGRANMALNWGGQNFIRDPLAFDLDPIVTTQYEVGYSQQLGEEVAFDVTAFAKNTEGQLVVTLVEAMPGAASANYTVYSNGDFTTVSGLEMTLSTRRINHVQSFLSYTYTDARGTNAFPNSNIGNLALGAERPTLITPLRYEQQHKGSLNLDVRFGDEAGFLLDNTGVNLLFTFNSGHPFTLSTGGMGQRAAYEGALLVDSDPRNRQPVEPIGASRTPWYFNADLKADRTFAIAGVNFTAYVTATNLFNRDHILNVYNRTGNAHDDGFLSDPELSEKIVEAQGETYEEMYRKINLGHRQHWIADQGFDLFGTPRQIKAGITVAF